MIHTYRKKDRSFLKYSTSTIVVVIVKKKNLDRCGM